MTGAVRARLGAVAATNIPGSEHSGHKELSYPVMIVALVVPAVGCALALAVVRCRRAGRLIDRILAEELGPRADPPAPTHERYAERIT